MAWLIWRIPDILQENDYEMAFSPIPYLLIERKTTEEFLPKSSPPKTQNPISQKSEKWGQ